jgi:hypothetical protein
VREGNTSKGTRQRERLTNRSYPWCLRYNIGNDAVPGGSPREICLREQLRLLTTRPAMAALRYRRVERVTTRTGETAGGESTPPVEAQNLANPMIGCRVQQTCSAMRGESRCSREKRQERNMRVQWYAHAEGQPSSEDGTEDSPFLENPRRKPNGAAWERTRNVYVDEGAIFANPMRGDPARRESGTTQALRR